MAKIPVKAVNGNYIYDTETKNFFHENGKPVEDKTLKELLVRYAPVDKSTPKLDAISGSDKSKEPNWAEKMDDSIRNAANNEMAKWKDSLPKNTAPVTKKVLPTVSKTTTSQPKIDSSMEPTKVERTELKSSEDTPKQVAQQKEPSPVAKDNTKSNVSTTTNNSNVVNSSPYLQSGQWGTGSYHTENAFGFQRSPWSGGGRLDPNINESFNKFMIDRNRSKLGGSNTTDKTPEEIEQKSTDNKVNEMTPEKIGPEKEMTPVKPTLNTNTNVPETKTEDDLVKKFKDIPLNDLIKNPEFKKYMKNL